MRDRTSSPPGPQLSHLCGEGFQSASDGGSRYILQRESVLFLYTTPSNRFIIVSSASSRGKVSTPFILHILCSHVPIIHLGSLQHVVTSYRERAQGSVTQHSFRVWICFGVVKPGQFAGSLLQQTSPQVSQRSIAKAGASG